MVMAGHSHVFGGEEQLPLAIADHPDPFVLELTRLQNRLKEKDRKLGAAQAEIKALRATEALKDKVIEELGEEVQTLDEKHRVAENLLQQKNLEMKKLADEKKDAVAAQFAAEATLRRVYANQKDDEDVSMESIIAPLKAEIKMYKNEEENKILEKTNRQKVLEIEKLSQTIKELVEAILVGGATANSIRDCRRQISQLREEKRTLERELARVKVLANRVVTVVANEWKDENDKVMPVKQWLEDRRLLQAEMQRLKDKLSMSVRTAKAEAQLKDKFKLRLKILEDGLKHISSISINPNASYGSPKPEKSINILGFLTSTGGLKKRSTSQPRASTISTSSSLQRPRATSGENMVRKKLWASRCKVADSNEKENAEMKVNGDSSIRKDGDTKDSAEIKSNGGSNEQTGNRGIADSNAEDMVSGFLYDRLQKEVINLRKLCEAKDSSLNTKDEEIKMLMKKVEAFSRAIEVEAKRVKRESLTKEKENGSAKMGDDTKKMKHINSSKTRRLVLTLNSSLLFYFIMSTRKMFHFITNIFAFKYNF
ncbi:hypothetical protein ES332_A05G190700v1 [Gossypium tomentosum]|uniref:Microtubule-associated protein 70-5 n=1 Tax=Gossypium tomentosum TaxID=34277 RepID=A0A5D2QGF2_GOSTO|nr:hypothetical protein ES332_A05G190700v1 [Gossypium tomentosum]